MSVGRVVVDGLLGSKEDNFFVHMLDQENAGEYFLKLFEQQSNN